MNSLRALVLLLAAPALAQTWNSNAGGYTTGYGTVYGSFGLAMATQNMYTTMQLNLQRSMAREAMIKQHGRAAVEKAEREAAQGRQSSLQVTPPPAPAKNLGAFKPGKSTVARQLADALGSTKEEKTLIAALVTGTKEAFEAQPETRAWKNNVAGALAFFLLSNLMVASDGPEPNDTVSQAVFQAINQSLDASPDFVKASAKDKQQLYEVLLAFTGLPLASYTEGKERGDAEQVKQAGQLAAQLLELVFKADVKTLKLP